MTSNNDLPVIIVGGGTAGICVAARLKRQLPQLKILIIEPSEKHYYQPLWTLVGAGVFPLEASCREESTLIPAGVEWLKDRVTKICPAENKIMTDHNNEFLYSILVVCPGIQINWDGIRGLKEAIGKDGVCSNYSREYVSETWRNIQNFQGGVALFTNPATPVKCGGAPQKIAYLAEDYFQITGIRSKCKVIFASAQKNIFSVKKYADSLEKVIERKNIQTLFEHNLVEIKPQTKEAFFQVLDSEKYVSIKYDMLHVTPPMSCPDFLKESNLTSEAGWVDVDPATLQHRQFKNIFSLGDAAGLPTSKTGAAIRKQAPVAVDNIVATIKNQELTSRYDGYTSCPLVTGYKGLILAEFDYDLIPQETFPFDQSKERYSMYLLKKYMLPKFYWDGMLKGRM